MAHARVWREMPDKREIYALKRIISLLSGMTGWGAIRWCRFNH